MNKEQEITHELQTLFMKESKFQTLLDDRQMNKKYIEWLEGKVFQSLGLSNNLEDVTADSMRALVSKKESDELNDVLRKIKKEGAGDKSVYIYGYSPSASVKKELEKRGFKVEVGGRMNETDTYITW